MGIRFRSIIKIIVLPLLIFQTVTAQSSHKTGRFAPPVLSRTSPQEKNLLSTGKTNNDSHTRLLFERGIRHYNTGRYYSALDIFRRLKNYPPEKNSLLTASYLLCMKSYFRIGRLEKAREVGREFLIQFHQSSYLDDVHECYGDIFLEEGRYGAAVSSYLKGRSISNNDSTVTRLENKIKQLANGLVTTEEIEDLLATELDTPNRSILTLLLANTLLARGKSDEAALSLFRMDTESLPLGFQTYYKTLRSRTYRNDTKSVMVGVVVPLSGFDMQFGKAFLTGVRSAEESLRDRLSVDIVLELIDNEGDNLKTYRCVKTLAANPNVLAIIGPLSTVNSITATAVSDALSVPLLVPISTRSGLAEGKRNVYQMNPDLFRQGRYAAEYAVSALGLETLAVVAPADRFGKELTDGFVQQADELGANVVAIEWYSGIPVDLSSQFESLRKVGFELIALQPDTSDLDIDLDTTDNTFLLSEEDFFPDEESDSEVLTPADSSQFVLSTIDCVYLPIHAGDISYVASQFFSHSFDAQLLGNANWYEPEELDQEMIGPNLEGMVILTDYLHVDDSKNPVFIDELAIHLNNREEYRIALFGYDIMLYLSSQFGQSPTRATLIENLNRTQAFRGSGKNFSFINDFPRVNSSMHILKYFDGKFKIVGEVISDSLLSYMVQSP